MTEQSGEFQDTHGEAAGEANPRWLVVLGAIILVAMMLAAAFALGVYMAERNLL
ncbi:MAG: hypothetical protein M3328_06715 [Chloroflexota bacterium]|nr:hypothetical protein [Chloroflexota bacterium]